MKRLQNYKWVLINGFVVAANAVFDALFVFATDNPLRLWIHTIIAMMLLPLALAGLLNVVIALTGKEKKYWVNYKNNYKYSFLIIMLFFGFGTFSAIVTDTQIYDWQ
jgi:hypothetical protein